MRRKADNERVEQNRIAGEPLLGLGKGRRCKRLRFIVVEDLKARRLFDRVLDDIHYAGACQRVGRCMRLAVTNGRDWLGGIVLGSTFPNIAVRDEAFGLSQHIRNTKARGLISPFAAENRDYWDRLQKIVNHARTFVFPAFQGSGIGIEMHRLLLTEGRAIWEAAYNECICGFDTLCTHSKSRLFLENGWTLVGRTKGYTRDPQAVFSARRAFEQEWTTIEENAGLGILKGSKRWWIWVKVFQEAN